MRLVIDMDNSKVIYKKSGELPEQLKAYIFIYQSNSEVYGTIIGFYQPYYNNNNGGVYDGIGTHIDWNEIVAWRCLEKCG